MSSDASAPLSIRLEGDAERVRQSHDRAIREQQARTGAEAVVRNVLLRNGVGTYVAHPLGRAPTFVTTGVPRGAATPGLIQDWGTLDPAGCPVDRSKTIFLLALGFGADITVDILVKG